MLEYAGFTVNTLWDGDSQANFTAAVANNDCVYVPSSVSTTDIGTKLRDCPIGVVNELVSLMDDLGLCTAAGTTTPIFFNLDFDELALHHQRFRHWLLLARFAHVHCCPTRRHDCLRATVLWPQSAASTQSLPSTPAERSRTRSTATASRSAAAYRCPFHSARRIRSTLTSNAQHPSAERILLWAAGFDGDLEAHWKLNETSGTSAADSSGNFAHGHRDRYFDLGRRRAQQRLLVQRFDENPSHRPDEQPAERQRRRLGQSDDGRLGGAEIISLGDHFLLRLDESGVTKAQFYNGSTYVSVDLARDICRHRLAPLCRHVRRPAQHVQAVYRRQAGRDRLDNCLRSLRRPRHEHRYRPTRQCRHHPATSPARSTTFAFTATCFSDTDVAGLFGFIGRWKLNETSGTTAADSTLFDRDATVSGTASWSTDCGGMGAFDFNGSSQLLQRGQQLPTSSQRACFRSRPGSMATRGEWLRQRRQHDPSQRRSQARIITPCHLRRQSRMFCLDDTDAVRL